MPTVRQLLAAAPPPVSMRGAWRAWLQAVRAARRQTGAAVGIRDRAGLERALDREVHAELDETAAIGERITTIKRALRDLVHGELSPGERHERALAVDRLLADLAPPVVSGPVGVRVMGWPAGIRPDQRAAIIGEGDGERLVLPAERAAALFAAVDGLHLGGSRLSVEVDPPAGARLPAVPRRLRDRTPRGGRAWLPHLDEVGRMSLTDRALATRQAAWLGRPVILDAFCGCGGNAIAAALAGHRVTAIERDPERAALARRNAAALGVRIDLRLGDAAALLPALLDAFPDAGLLLDPPWGGAGSGRRPVGWDALVPLPVELLARAPALLLKAPPAFVLASLPAGWSWSWRFELTAPAADGRAVVRALSCRGLRR